MISVPIDRIVPLTDARDNFSRLVSDVEADTEGLYLLTKGGKPSIALVNIDYLEKLMGSANVTASKLAWAPKPPEPRSKASTLFKTQPPPPPSPPKPSQPKPEKAPEPSPAKNPTGPKLPIDPSWTGRDAITNNQRQTNVNPWPIVHEPVLPPKPEPKIEPPVPPIAASSQTSNQATDASVKPPLSAAAAPPPPPSSPPTPPAAVGQAQPQTPSIKPSVSINQSQQSFQSRPPAPGEPPANPTTYAFTRSDPEVSKPQSESGAQTTASPAESQRINFDSPPKIEGDQTEPVLSQPSSKPADNQTSQVTTAKDSEPTDQSAVKDLEI